MEERCPYCGLDPYEYADVGIGFVRVAITCCSYGYLLYTGKKSKHQIHKIMRNEKRELKKDSLFLTKQEIMRGS